MCLFCNIIEKEIPAKIIYENSDFISFYDINPKAKIHALIVPKEHFDSFNNVNSKTMEKMTKFIKDVAKKLRVHESGYRLITNINEDANQEVKHLHFHMLGGEKLSI